MITSSIFIKDSADRIWQALTDRNQMKEWYFDIPDFELAEGAKFNFYEPGGANQFHHHCVIREIVPGKKFSHTWTHPSRTRGISLVSWYLNEVPGGTKVVLTHEGTENFADAGPEFAPENYQHGWDGFMAILKNYVYGFRKHTFQIEINAAPEKIWKALLDDQYYRRWTSVFSEGSCLTGELKPRGRVHFLNGKGNGMYSDIIFLTPGKNILFQHIGEVNNYQEQPVDEKAEQWTGTFENYTIKEKDGKTVLEVEVDVAEKDVPYFEDRFPKALEKLKSLAETIG